MADSKTLLGTKLLKNLTLLTFANDFQTHFFGRLMKEASWHLSLLMGIPISLVFIAIIAEFVMDMSSRHQDSDYETVDADE